MSNNANTNAPSPSQNSLAADVNSAARAAEYSSIRMQSLLETVTAQRNDAQNAVANLTADKAVIERALKDMVAANRAANERNVHLQDEVLALAAKVADLQAALAESHAALRNRSPGVAPSDNTPEEHY